MRWGKVTQDMIGNFLLWTSFSRKIFETHTRNMCVWSHNFDGMATSQLRLLSADVEIGASHLLYTYILPLSYYHRKSCKSWKRGREWVLELLLLPLLTKSLTSNSSKELWILIQTTKNKLLLLLRMFVM